MPSGKKARGRKNRAKKEATLTAAQRTLWEKTILRNNGASNNATASSCEHVLAVLPRIPQEGPAVSFMNSLAGRGFFSSAKRFTAEELSVKTVTRFFPKVREDESERSLAIDLLLRFIRNVLLHGSATEGETWFHERQQNELAICTMINMLELCGTYSDRNVVESRAAKVDYRLAGGNRRDVAKFVAKRLPCACLKKLHSAARKKLSKMGTCVGCNEQLPRSQLHVCTGCMIDEYCSKECQRADWSNHKQGCGYPEVMRRDLPVDYFL